MYLCMTVVATGYTVICTGFHDLLKFEFSVVPSLFRKAGLEKATTTATAVVVRLIGRHFNDVFLSNDLFYDIAQIFSNGIAVAFANYLARVLNGKLDFAVFIPL